MKNINTPNIDTINRALRPERSELLMPAGSLENLKTAILYGADAVYAGTPDLSLRTKSSFSLEELLEGIAFAHERGKRVYLTLNLYAHNKDIEKLPAFIETIKESKPDGVIIADSGVFHYVKEHAPELELHVSTQANICSWLTVQSWQKQGASLCVLAREVSFAELEEIRQKCPDVKLEAFVHGAMCMTYSGRCLLSNFMAERGANQGNCAHSCRWKYKFNVKLKDGTVEELKVDETNKDLFNFLLEEGSRPGELMEIQEDERGSYILSSKDLCLMPKLNDYLRIGVDSLKVEGRHKTSYYVAAVTRAYRKAIDDWYIDPENWSPKPYMDELNAVQNRGYTLAFHNGRLTNHSHDYETTMSVANQRFGGFIRAWEGDDIIFEVRNTLESGDVIEFMPTGTIENVRLRLYDFVDAKNGKTVQKASGGQGFAVRIPLSAFHNQDTQKLKDSMPVLTVARVNTPDETGHKFAKTQIRQKSHQLESGDISNDIFQQFLKKYSKTEKPVAEEKSTKKENKQGQCCGRGCNGCLTFWNDPKYAKAREKLAKKDSGTRLTKSEKAEL